MVLSPPSWSLSYDGKLPFAIPFPAQASPMLLSGVEQVIASQEAARALRKPRGSALFDADTRLRLARPFVLVGSVGVR